MAVYCVTRGSLDNGHSSGFRSSVSDVIIWCADNLPALGVDTRRNWRDLAGRLAPRGVFGTHWCLNTTLVNTCIHFCALALILNFQRLTRSNKRWFHTLGVARQVFCWSTSRIFQNVPSQMCFSRWPQRETCCMPWAYLHKSSFLLLQFTAIIQSNEAEPFTCSMSQTWDFQYFYVVLFKQMLQVFSLSLNIVSDVSPGMY